MSKNSPATMMEVDLEKDVYIDPELNAREGSVTPEHVQELAASIQQTQGLLQGIGLVPTSPERKAEHDKPYELSYGYSRCAALQLLHEENPEYGWLENVPASVREVDETSRLMDQLIENLHRNSMNPFEVGRQFKKILANDPQLSQKGLAKRIGYSDATVSQYLSVTKLAEEVQSLGLANKLSFSAAREIAALDLPVDQQLLAAELGANLPFGEFVEKMRDTYKKGEGVPTEGGGEAADGTPAAPSTDGTQKPSTEGIRAKVIADKYLPKLKELAEAATDKKEKAELAIRIDTVNFLLKRDGTELGAKLAPWEEELIKTQKEKEDKEEKDRLRKKFVRQSVQILNKIISEEPPPEAEVRTKKNVNQALAEIQATVKGLLAQGQKDGLAANMIPAGFIVDNVDTLMQEIHAAWKESEESKRKKKEENAKKKAEEAAKEKAEEEAKEAKKGEVVTA